MSMIHFQDLLVPLMNLKEVDGFVHSLLLYTSHTSMLILQMFWIDLRSHSFHLEEHLQKKKIYQPRFLWTILDMHHSYIYSNIYWDFCDIYSTQKNGIIT